MFSFSVALAGGVTAACSAFTVSSLVANLSTGDFVEQSHFALCQLPPPSELQLRIPDRTNRNALELIDRVADRVEHVPALAVSPFMDGDLQGGWGIAAARQQAPRACRHALSLAGDPARQSIEIVRVG